MEFFFGSKNGMLHSINFFDMLGYLTYVNSIIDLFHARITFMTQLPENHEFRWLINHAKTMWSSTQVTLQLSQVPHPLSYNGLTPWL